MEKITPNTPINNGTELKKSCINCGAELLYAPGTAHLNCNYCGYTEDISATENSIEELELKKYLDQMGAQSHSEEITMLHCKNCGANQHVEENYKSLHCVYCSMPLIVEDIYKDTWITPGAVLPFQINQEEAHTVFKKWVNSLWFAPNKFKKASLDPQNTKGLYSPYWTFDAQLHATFTGKRGKYYYVTKSVGTGKNRRNVRQRRTRWTSVSGKISGFVDDTLTKASLQRSGIIPKKIAKWDFKKLEPFNSSYLRGFITEKYTIPLKEGHLESKKEVELIARRWVKRKIGGDTQQISTMNMTLTKETFKHILLPVYISAYRFKEKRYNFFVNGQNGMVSGARPYSFWKIFFFALSIILVLLVLYFFMTKFEG